jgi:hypothetical protein
VPDFWRSTYNGDRNWSGITIFGLYMVNHSIRKARRLALKTRFVDRFTLSQNIDKLKKSQALTWDFFNKYFSITRLFSLAIYIPSFT